jgi:hypothetical protein
MATVPASTTLERTYRYLRMGIAGAVVILFSSVTVAAASVGWLPSVSHYFYTPARSVFVGVLVAVALALFALSGRGAERALLDAAALMAPLIAFVPTTIAPGSVPGLTVPCDHPCVPPGFVADAANGVAAYLIGGGLVLTVALLLAALRQLSLAQVGLSLIITAVVLGAVAVIWAVAPDVFLQQVHFVATVIFFGLMAAVAVRNAFPRRETPPAPVYRALYTAIAAGLVVVLVAYVALLPRLDEGFGLVLVVEAAALTLFTAFWVVQGIEKWNDADPSLIAR